MRTLRTHPYGIRDERLPGDPPPGRLTAPRCGLCGRVLADPASRARGYGPRCARRLTPPPRRATIPAPRTDGVPGQTELPLVDLQPTLWSL
ncbi:DUF6011 domain-containing protein [Streptomyces sp. SCSIO ZS0520]|uniref:DUF6011 domain-containing protein n=1 Tax=Streptomyces sp. SCSIO ZS0520 TaxID=2892996 RepID=UPI0021D7D3BE|nr:DUF6011 domain-containing protein [Streptomyces sp. SCSIO ZS0520]